MFHGVMDDYSWLITFLKFSTNNKAETTLTLLDYTSEIYGFSPGVAVDKTRKITLILRKKSKFRKLSGSYIAASSVNN